MTRPGSTCAICGLFLHAQHSVSITIDDRIAHRLSLCLYHTEKLRDTIERALVDERPVRAVA